jgi:hypothetical protein
MYLGNYVQLKLERLFSKDPAFSTYFWYSYTGGRFKHTYTGFPSIRLPTHGMTYTGS